MKTILQEKEIIHNSTFFGSQICSFPKAMKIPASKAAMDKERKISRYFFGVESDEKSEVRKRWSMKEGRKA